MRLGRAAVRAFPGDSLVVVGRDTRESGQMLESALVAGLLSEGARVLLAWAGSLTGVLILVALYFGAQAPRLLP